MLLNFIEAVSGSSLDKTLDICLSIQSAV